MNLITYCLFFIGLWGISSEDTNKNFSRVSYFFINVDGHGRLLEPPSRSSMWRFESTDPMLIPYKDVIQPNYDDNGLNCGGKQTQIDNNGMCGVCGDSYTAPVKENEAGGKYAQGIITRRYKAGDIIATTIEITAEHKGYFEFRLCPWNDVNTPVTHECLNRHLLSFENGETKWYLPEDHAAAQGTQNLKLRLPNDVTCEQCVLQWRYRAGNSWGYENGEEGMGLGQQEEFYGCSDVAISSEETVLLSTSSSSLRSTSVSTTTSRATNIAESSQSSSSSTKSTTSSENTQETTTLSDPPSTTQREIEDNQYPKIDCSKEEMGLPIYRDCHSFYICAFPQYDAFIFACPDGTVCNPKNGHCDHPYNVPPPCNIV